MATFEEYIVGRLMEKLQMASHAIGDIEAILQASGVDEDDGDVATDGIRPNGYGNRREEVRF